MEEEWGSLPLLPLRCVMSYLSLDDVLAASSTCQHWRNSMLLYEGRKETLKLRAKQWKKNIFLTSIFRRKTRNLHIYLDGNETEVVNLMINVLPQYFDSLELRELIFIGPSYIQQNENVPFIKLRRIVVESLWLKHAHCLETFALLGCEMDEAKNNEEYFVSTKHRKYFSRSFLFTRNSILSTVNLKLHNLTSSLRHIIVDYSQVSTSSLLTLEPLRQLRHLTLNMTNKRVAWPPMHWRKIQSLFKPPLQVSINIISVPYRRFNEIIHDVLVDGLNLISLKVMFCKSLYTPLLTHVARLYQDSLRELVWADCPFESNDPYHRYLRPMLQMQADHFAHVNPFVLLCWQCIHLRRLVIHGYWMWHYDLIGFVRLRKTLAKLEISSIYDKQGQFDNEVHMSEEGTVRVMLGDPPTKLDNACIDEVNEYTDFKWAPIPSNSLHPGLRIRSTAAERADYVLCEARQSLGVTSY